MLDQALGFLSHELAIDLGSANTLIYMRGRGIVVEEPSVVAVERPRSGARVLAFGIEAKRMVGRTPEHITAIRPVREGAIHDFPLAESLLHACLERTLGGRSLVRPRVIAAVPHGTNEVQRRAVADSARSAGCREVTLIDGLIAAGLGCDLPVQDPIGSLVVNIGAGTTEVGVLSLGGVAASTTLTLAGDDIDAAIAQWVREKHNLLIGERTAEEIKLAIGCARPPSERRAIQITGRDLREGIPREITLTSDEISEAVQPPLKRIIEAIQQTLSRTPPELAADIHEHGMILCGGTALLPDLNRMLSDISGLPVIVAADPIRCVALGAGRLLTTDNLLERASI